MAVSKWCAINNRGASGYHTPVKRYSEKKSRNASRKSYRWSHCFPI